MNDPRWSRLREILREHSFREGDFVLASGKRSSFYVDVRRTSLHVEGAALIGELLHERIRAAGWAPDAVGGLTLGADPLATSVSLASWRAGDRWHACIVRKEAKAHGAGRQIETAGGMPEGGAVVVLDDTITTGGSTVQAVEAMRSAGYRVLGAACVVDRGEGGEERLREAGLSRIALFGIDDLRG